MTYMQMIEAAEMYVSENGFTSDYNNIASVEANREVLNAYLAGMKLGFEKGIKANVNIESAWHNLRKNPDDLPQEGETVLCYCLGVHGASYPITAQVYFDYYSSDHYWWPSADSGNRPLEELRNVLAWKEIVVPLGVCNEEEIDKV